MWARATSWPCTGAGPRPRPSRSTSNQSGSSANGIAAGSRASGCTFPPTARRWISHRCRKLAPMRPRNPLAEVPPDQFVKARDALVRKLRDEGQTEEARRIAALRRPSTALWIVNQLARRDSRAVDALIEASQRAQQAQLHGGGSDELRDAMHAQRETMRRLLGEADKAARDAGTALTLELQRRIQDTVQTAATAEPDALRAGTLEHELSPAGFGALLSGTAAVAAKAAERRQGFEARVDEQKRRVAEKRERILREREVQRAQQISRRLAALAEQLERVSAQARQAAEKAQAKAHESRQAADSAAARLLQLRGRSRAPEGEALLPPFLVRAHQLDFRQQGAGEGALGLLPRGLAEIVERGVESVEQEEIRVPPDGRTGAAVAGLLPVVHPWERALRQRRFLDALGKPLAVRRDVVEHPVRVVHSRRRRFGRVRIVNDQGETLRALRRTGELERRRNVFSLTGVQPGDLAAVRERGGADGQHARNSAPCPGPVKTQRGTQGGWRSRASSSPAGSCSLPRTSWERASRSTCTIRRRRCSAASCCGGGGGAAPGLGGGGGP